MENFGGDRNCPRRRSGRRWDNNIKLDYKLCRWKVEGTRSGSCRMVTLLLEVLISRLYSLPHLTSSWAAIFL
jgi:hypothetical protein